MSEQAWFPVNGAGFDGSESGFAPPPLPLIKAKSLYELRPLTTGELLDRTFHLYRSYFWMFVGLASIAAGVNVLTALLKLVYQHYFGTFVLAGVAGPAASTGGVTKNAVFLVISLATSALYFAVYAVTHAATTSAVSSIYLGDATSMRLALNAVAGRWARFFGISLWQLWSAGWIFLALIVPAAMIYGLGIQSKMWIAGLLFFAASLSTIYGVIAYIRNSFAVPAAVMEDLGVRKAMRRSKVLTAGNKGRVFLLFLFLMALYFVVLAIQSPLMILIVQAKGKSQVLLSQGFGVFIGFIASAVIGPVGAIGLCLFYIDQRIRKEGFDIEFLIERSGPIPGPARVPVFEPVAEGVAAELP